MLLLSVRSLQESRLQENLDTLVATRARERLDELLEEGGDAVVQKVLNFLEYGSAKAVDEYAVFHRNMRKFGDLQFRELTALLESWHGELWASTITKRVRLPVCRALTCWALGVEPADPLPRRRLGELVLVRKQQYQLHPTQFAILA